MSAESLGSVVLGLGGNRRLGVAYWGDPSGRPVFVLHGTPGSRLLRHLGPPGMTYADLGVRAITYDRPGYGESTAQPGRRVVDAAGDVNRIADALGLDTFGVLGVSGGAPHALAVAAGIPTRVVRCAVVVGSAPLHAPDLAFFDGMAAEVRDFWDRVRARDVNALRASWQEFGAWVEAGLPGLSVASPVVAMLRDAFTEAARPGPEGYLGDWLAFAEPWGFDVRDVAVPVKLMFARGDDSIPKRHVEWYQRHLPDAEVVWVDGDHFGPRDEPEMALVAWTGRGTD